MSWIKKLKLKILFDTYGAIAIGSLLICAVSGIFAAIPYDVNNPFDSISVILITNPFASFFRNIHYWSAQFFLVFTFLHLYDHLRTGTEKNQTHGTWVRLIISIPVVFYVMITGFILKADTDSVQARRVLSSLFETIPYAGKILSSGLLGKEGDLQIIYMHHVSTSTIFLLVIIWEHARTIWIRTSTFLGILAILTLISVILNAPFNDLSGNGVKGPWYFVGLQEILHWTSNPGWVVIISLSLILSLYILLHLPEIPSLIIKKVLLGLFGLYMIFTVTGIFLRGENWNCKKPWDNNRQYINSFRMGWDLSSFNFSKFSERDLPKILGRREACLLCHDDISGLSPSHDPKGIGCVSCHLGDPFTVNKNRAHKNLILIPGNLDQARHTCGTIQCHPDLTSRINFSLMTTNSGIVSVDRFVFGETNSPDAFSSIKEIKNTPADQHLRNLCANCHLGNKKDTTGSISELSRGGGCNACHLNYSKAALDQHNDYLINSKSEIFLPKIHPSVDLNITNDHCFGCHSRSGRISTNYEGWHETLLDDKDAGNNGKYRILEDKRVFEFISPDIHHERNLECIDCHISYELMGNGTFYLHEEETVKIMCEDCHNDKQVKTTVYENLDPESRKIFDIRKFNLSDRHLNLISDSGLVFVNIFIDHGQKKLIGKNSKKIHPIKVPAAICNKEKVHKSLSCSSCHSAWAPRCIGCHNEFERKSDGYDLLENKSIQGTWVEYVDKFLAEPPALGVRTGKENKIEPCVPGMILSINKSGYDSNSTDPMTIFHRLYAPVSPHTTSTKGRGCKSCHNNSVTMGYGRGKLKFVIQDGKGRWEFQPEFSAGGEDGLPADAWIGFLSEPKGIVATRTDFRPFTLQEQKKILAVGACLTCHEESSNVIKEMMNFKYSEYMKKISSDCILPIW